MGVSFPMSALIEADRRSREGPKNLLKPIDPETSQRMCEEVAARASELGARLNRVLLPLCMPADPAMVELQERMARGEDVWD